MEKARLAVRVLLGIMLIVFGLNKFMGFIQFPPMTPQATDFMSALIKSGYIMAIVGIVEIVTGVLILIDKYKALALVIVFPVMLNALFFHLFLDPSGMAGALVAVAMILFLAWQNKSKYSKLFEA